MAMIIYEANLVTLNHKAKTVKGMVLPEQLHSERAALAFR